MTATRKPRLGFGAPILLFVLACPTISLGETVWVEEPTRAAAHEMEMNATEVGRDVRGCRSAGDERYLERFENDKADTRRGRDLGPKISAAGRLVPGVPAGLRQLGDPDLIAELAGMFVHDAAERLEELRRAVGTGDAGIVERAAHTLECGAGNMGADGMSRISDLQDAGARDDPARVGNLVDELQAAAGGAL